MTPVRSPGRWEQIGEASGDVLGASPFSPPQGGNQPAYSRRRLCRPARAALAEDIAPIDDIRSSRDYRLAVAGNLLEQFLRAASRR